MTIFDLEQAILNAWNGIDDLDLIIKKIKNSNDREEDLKMLESYLSIQNLKFENLFSVFEDYKRSS